MLYGHLDRGRHVSKTSRESECVIEREKMSNFSTKTHVVGNLKDHLNKMCSTDSTSVRCEHRQQIAQYFN